MAGCLGCQNSGASRETPLRGQAMQLEAALNTRAHPHSGQTQHSTRCKAQDASAIPHPDHHLGHGQVSQSGLKSSLSAVAVQQREHSHCIFHPRDVHDHYPLPRENAPYKRLPHQFKVVTRLKNTRLTDT